MPKALLDESEGQLVASAGVYGIWLLKHGTNLPENEKTQEIKGCYADYLKDEFKSAMALFDKIDEFIATTGWEDVYQAYGCPLGFDDELEDED